MGSTRRSTTALLAVAVVVVGTLGTAAAVADQDTDAGQATDPETLLETLDALEGQLPGDVDVIAATLDAETTWGTFSGDAGSVSAVLETLAPELRALFIEADDADGDVGEAVAIVARGWLDIGYGTAALSAYESHDLAFPIDTFDEHGVATGADELRGTAEVGLELLLQGRARHLEGYAALSALGAAEPEAQARLDARAVAARTFDNEVRPVLQRVLSQQTTTILFATERFETDGPGVDPRANAVTYMCVDREVAESFVEDGEYDGMTLQEFFDTTHPPRTDCPELPQDGDLAQGEGAIEVDGDED